MQNHNFLKNVFILNKANYCLIVEVVFYILFNLFNFVKEINYQREQNDA